MLFVVKQQNLTGNMVTCYEASAFWFHLHQRLEELGIENDMVQPQNWNERGKGVKNDRLDAAALRERLDRCERGNKKAFSTVRFPTVDEERKRAISPSGCRVHRAGGFFQMALKTTWRDAVLTKESSLPEAGATEGFNKFLDLATETAGTRDGNLRSGERFTRTERGRRPSASGYKSPGPLPLI